MFTWHFKNEWEQIGKPIEFVLDILEHGEHRLVSKHGQKWNVHYPYRSRALVLSYALHEHVIPIHIKPARRRVH